MATATTSSITIVDPTVHAPSHRAIIVDTLPHQIGVPYSTVDESRRFLLLICDAQLSHSALFKAADLTQIGFASQPLETSHECSETIRLPIAIADGDNVKALFARGKCYKHAALGEVMRCCATIDDLQLGYTDSQDLQDVVHAELLRTLYHDDDDDDEQ